jgi:hypothetical protein
MILSLNSSKVFVASALRYALIVLKSLFTGMPEPLPAEGALMFEAALAPPLLRA